jgi:hypothetical protein
MASNDPDTVEPLGLIETGWSSPAARTSHFSRISASL